LMLTNLVKIPFFAQFCHHYALKYQNIYYYVCNSISVLGYLGENWQFCALQAN